jgi:hypothetical protein
MLVSRQIWWCVVLPFVLSIGCRGDAPPRSPVAPPPAGSTIQFPEDVVAVMDIDVPKVRASALWNVVRRALDWKSSLVATCPEVLDQAQRASVALRTHDGSRDMTMFAIVYGIDRASTLACLRAPQPGGLAGASPLPGGSRRLACQRLDDAVDGLAQCGPVPRTLAGELDGARTQLAEASPADMDAACTRALAVAERVNARRADLGWTCDEPSLRDPARHAGNVQQLAPSTLLLDGVELLHFVDDRTAVIVREELSTYDEVHGRSTQAAQADLRTLQAARPAPRWYDAARAARDPARAIWLAIDPARLMEGQEGEDQQGEDQEGEGDEGSSHVSADSPRAPPPRIIGTIDVERDVNIELQVPGLSYSDAFRYEARYHQILAWATTEPMFHGARLAAVCTGPAPGGPRAEACARTLAHLDEIDRDQTGAGSGSASSLLPQLSADAALRACVERPWPASHLACLNAAPTREIAGRCDPRRADEPLPAICGERPASLRVTLPLLLVESLKLLAVTHRKSRQDCSPPDAFLPESVVVGPVTTHGGGSLPLAASLCRDSSCAPAIDLAATHAGHNDGRWHDMAYDEHPRCTGPFYELAVSANHARSEDRCDRIGITLQTTATRAELCRHGADNACASIPTRDPIYAFSVNVGARYAALVVGVPGAQSIETWDITAQKRLGRFSAGTSHQRPCARAQLLDDIVLVDTGACKGLGASERELTEAGLRAIAHTARSAATEAGAFLATLQGHRITAVGGDRPLATLGGGPVLIAGHRWAFVASRGDTVVIQDVATGTVERRIATGEQIEPGKVAASADDLGHLVLVFAGATARAGGLVLVDAASGTVQPIPARTTCPATTTP